VKEGKPIELSGEPWYFETKAGIVTRVIIPKNIAAFADCALSAALYAGINAFVDSKNVEISDKDLDTRIKVVDDKPSLYFYGACDALRRRKLVPKPPYTGSQGQGFKYVMMYCIRKHYKKYLPFTSKGGYTPEYCLYQKEWSTNATPEQRRMIALFKKLCNCVKPDAECMNSWLKSKEAVAKAYWRTESITDSAAYMKPGECEVINRVYNKAASEYQKWLNVFKEDDNIVSLSNYYNTKKDSWASLFFARNSVIKARAASLTSLTKAERKRLIKQPWTVKVNYLSQEAYITGFSPLLLFGVNISLPEQEEGEIDSVYARRLHTFITSTVRDRHLGNVEGTSFNNIVFEFCTHCANLT
jgi:hypothetical protein